MSENWRIRLAKVLLINAVGAAACAVVNADDAAASGAIWPERCPPSVVSKQMVEGVDVVRHVKDFHAVRHGIATAGHDLNVEMLGKAISLMKGVDFSRRSGESEDLKGYNAIRAIHGIDGDGLSDDRPEKDLFCRLSMWTPKDFDKIWGKCQHGPTIEITNSGDPEIDLEHPLFLLWHRAYLRAFEISVKSALKKSANGDFDDFGIPYWDWSSVLGRSVPEDFRPSGPSCDLINGGCNPLVDTHRSAKAQEGLAIWNPNDSVNPFLSSNISFATFSLELLSTWHNAIHAGVGLGGDRDMGATIYAVNDPLFWVHHSNIDRLFVEWIRRNSGAAQKAFSDPALADAWEKGRFRFPINLDGKAVWYQPDFKELQLDLLNPMNYSYERRPSEQDIELPKPVLPADFVRAIKDKYRVNGLVGRADTKNLLRRSVSIARDGGFIVGPNGLIVSATLSSEVFSQIKSVRHSLVSRQIKRNYTHRTFLILDGLKFGSGSLHRQYQLFLNIKDKSESKNDSYGDYYVGTLSGFGSLSDADAALFRHEAHQDKALDITSQIDAARPKSSNFVARTLSLLFSGTLSIKLAIVPSDFDSAEHASDASNASDTDYIKFDSMRLIVIPRDETAEMLDQNRTLLSAQ